MPMRPGWITALVLGASLASACGSAAIGDGSSPGDTEPGNGYPMRSASDMTAVARNELPAASALPFEASFPRSAGKPLVVFVYDPVQPLAGVDAEYDASSPYGAFRLREERTPAGVLERDFVRSLSGFCSDGGDGAGSGCTSALVDVGAGLRGSDPLRPERRHQRDGGGNPRRAGLQVDRHGAPCHLHPGSGRGGDARCRRALPSRRLSEAAPRERLLPRPSSDRANLHTRGQGRQLPNAGVEDELDDLRVHGAHP